MTTRDFVYWLQGYFEILGELQNDDSGFDAKNRLTLAQVRCIRNHLNMVFKHEIDPSFGDQDVQKELRRIHEGFKPPEVNC